MPPQPFGPQASFGPPPQVQPQAPHYETHLQPNDGSMPQQAFQQLLDAVHRCAFDDERRAVIRSAASVNVFTCAQLGDLLRALNFEDERLYAVDQLAPRLVDPQNHFTVLAAVTFGDEKTKVERILAHFKTPAVPGSIVPNTVAPATIAPSVAPATVAAPQSQPVVTSPAPQAETGAGESAYTSFPAAETVAPATDSHASSVDVRAHDGYATHEEMTANMGSMSIAPQTHGAQQGAPSSYGTPGGAMDSTGFEDLLQRIRSAVFDDDRRGVIQAAATTNFFSCMQLAEILRLLNFEDERLAATQLVAPRIVDPTNHHVIVDVLTFGDEKQKVEQILSQFRPT